MKKWIVSPVYGSSKFIERFETQIEAQAYAEAIAISPSHYGVEFGVFKLETSAVFKPEPTIWTHVYPEKENP